MQSSRLITTPKYRAASCPLLQDESSTLGELSSNNKSSDEFDVRECESDIKWFYEEKALMTHDSRQPNDK